MKAVVNRRPRVLLTDAILPEAQHLLAENADVDLLPPGLTGPASDDALRQRIEEYDGLIVRRQLPADIFERPTKLRGVVRHGVGVDFIPVDRATVHGIAVANTPATNSNAVAEYAISAIFAMARRLAEFNEAVRHHNWDHRTRSGTHCMEIRGSTLGIIGFGAIGSRTADIASAGLQMNVVAHTSTPSKLPRSVESVDLNALFAKSDFIVVACPLTPSTRGLINADVLASAKKRPILINVARGPVIQQDDFIAALTDGSLGGAVLDVFDEHPLPSHSPLRTAPSVLLTPHVAGLTQDALRAMGFAAANTMAEMLEGKVPSSVVNPDFSKNTSREIAGGLNS
nr:hydroxyacid dehydrogenase [uncultured Cupriavidus sp.]